MKVRVNGAKVNEMVAFYFTKKDRRELPLYFTATIQITDCVPRERSHKHTPHSLPYYWKRKKVTGSLTRRKQ